MPMTVPTLVTVALSENPLICCLSRSLISVARTAMLAPFLLGLSAARALASFFDDDCSSHTSRARRRSTGCQPCAQAAQLVDDTAVDQLVAHPHDDAADDVRVSVRPDLDVLAGHLLEHLADRRLTILVQPVGGRHLGDRDAALGEHSLIEEIGDR